MIVPGVVSMVMSMLFMAFNPSEDAEIPYVRMLKAPKGTHIVKINSASDFNIEPFVADNLITAKEVFNKNNNIRLLINGGFFDPNNEKTISYVVMNGKVVLDPTQNEALMTNDDLKPHIDKILNRGEFRVLECGGKKKYDIAYHNDSVESTCSILHSIQAGPILDDRLDLEKEYFVVQKESVVVRDSISALKKVARSAVGIKNNDVYLFVVTDENPMTIEELSTLMKEKGMEKALAFDGGSSTSFENGDLSITSVGDNLGRKVKSFLVVNRYK